MNTLVRNTTLHFSRRSAAYQPLDQGSDATGDANPSRRTFSKRKTSLSFRRERAKKRQVFFSTYKLASLEDSKKSRSRKLKKFAVKVNSVVVLVFSFMRFNSLRCWKSSSATSASSPITPVHKCF